MAKKTTTAKKPTVAKKSFSGHPIYVYEHMEAVVTPENIYGPNFVLPASVDSPDAKDLIYNVVDFRIPDEGELYISTCGGVLLFEEGDFEEEQAQPRLIVARTKGREFTIKEAIGYKSLTSDITFMFGSETISGFVTQVKE